jgi:hypothetical protein
MGREEVGKEFAANSGKMRGWTESVPNPLTLASFLITENYFLE